MEVRRLGTRVDTQQSSRRFVWFILGLLVVSSIGYSFLSAPTTDAPVSPSSTTGVYPEGLGWAADVYGAHLTFSSDPVTLANITFETNVTLSELSTSTLYVADESALAQLSTSLGQLISLQEVCVGRCERDVPEKSCEGSEWILQWDRTATNGITQQKRCITIGGDAGVIDAFAYRLLNL